MLKNSAGPIKIKDFAKAFISIHWTWLNPRVPIAPYIITISRMAHALRQRILILEINVSFLVITVSLRQAHYHQDNVVHNPTE